MAGKLLLIIFSYKIIDAWFQRLPMTLVNDKGLYLTIEMFKSFMNIIGIPHIFQTLYDPFLNDQLEDTDCTFKEAINMKVDKKLTLETKVNRFLFRSTLHLTTRDFPAELLSKCLWSTAFHILKYTSSSSVNQVQFDIPCMNLEWMLALLFKIFH